MARERMSSVDTAWLRMDSPRNLMMIVGVDVFDRPMRPAELRGLLRRRLLKFARFRQKVVTDAAGSWWVDDPQFDLDHHLQSVKLAAPGDDVTLQALVAEKACEPLDPARPLWQFHLVQNYRGTSALIVRIHHCIADGIALIGVLMTLTDRGDGQPADGDGGQGDEPDDGNCGDLLDEDAVQSNPWKPYLTPLTRGAIGAIQATGTVWEKALGVIAQPERLSGYGRAGGRVVKDALSIALMPDDSATRLKGVPGERKVIAWNEPLPLTEVKLVSRALGASINDVLLSCVAGALRDYLLTHGDRVDGCEIRAMVPVNLRPLDQTGDLGNRFGLVPLTLPVGIANPIARLIEVHRRMEELKGGYQAVLAFGLLAVVGNTPRTVQSFVLETLARKATAVMTNVPGPQQPLYMAGARLSRMMFWVPQSGDVGMGVSILSYDGGVQFGLITDAGLCPDPQVIIDGFAVEFERLVLTLALLDPVLYGTSPDPRRIEEALFR
ncbi:MAG TPA: wax ester/triacylglycerol synthase family O-acyltransferase [Burkholderiaceae bacterium]|nr:wax ester/triacylglycerol synthase family O-acyltransferase [Burkholderiaceae bacterium]